VVEQVSEIAGKKLDRIRSCRLVGFTVSAAIVDEHRRNRGEAIEDRLPEKPIHRERMDERNSVHGADFVAVLDSLELIDEPRPVAGDGGRCSSLACLQVFLLHVGDESRQGGPEGGGSGGTGRGANSCP
jgi:hypothetical protein